MSGDQQRTTQENPVSKKSISLMDIVPKDHKLYHLFNFISLNYGDNPKEIIQAITTILNFDQGFKILTNSKKISIKNVFNLFRYTLPASLYSIEMILKIKKYIDVINEKELSEYDKKEKKLSEFLEIKDNNICFYDTQYLNEEIIFWLLKGPKTKGYKIKGYYNSSYKLLDKVSFDSDSTQIFILIEFNKEKILVDLNLKKLSTSYYCNLQYILKNTYSIRKTIQDLEIFIIKNFIHTFNIQENIIEYKSGLSTRRRLKIKENINQFNIEPLKKEIKEVLKHGRKRGYGFIGLQGTGKSMIIKKLEETLTETIIIKLGTKEFSTPFQIKKCFQFIKIVQPALVIIEDLDALGFKEKNERVGTFINEIDDSNNDLNIVLLVTINDTKLVHKTIIDRPGRFDEIFEIKPPQSELEIYEVMVSKYNRLKQFYTKFKNIEFPLQKDINLLLQRCLKNNFTQAEITCGIIEKVFINTEDSEVLYPLIRRIERAILLFEKSKKSLKEYSFNESAQIIDENIVKPTLDS